MSEPKAKYTIPTTTRTKTIKMCECGATRFQGPFTRGEIVDGEFRVQETLYQCVACNRVKPLEKIADHTVELLS